jgi:hypothetical protein
MDFITDMFACFVEIHGVPRHHQHQRNAGQQSEQAPTAPSHSDQPEQSMQQKSGARHHCGNRKIKAQAVANRAGKFTRRQGLPHWPILQPKNTSENQREKKKQSQRVDKNAQGTDRGTSKNYFSEWA